MPSSEMVYWHRDLPPLEAEMMGEHTVEANSSRVAGTLAHRNELWDNCYRELMAHAETRVADEVSRLGGHYAHVHGEVSAPRAATGLDRIGCSSDHGGEPASAG